MIFNKIEEALQDIKKGKMVIIVDGKNRENEGDLVLAAEFVTPQAINFMITHGKGLVCIAMTQEDLDKLNITQMVENNTDNHQTAFTISVDYKDTKTGISAFERALTIQQLINPESKAEDFKRPGHVFPLKARENGILDRPGHTEATVDLTELAGLKKAGVICEIINEDGEMARLPELKKIAKKWNLKIISITDLINFKKKIKLQIRKVSMVHLPTKFGNFLMCAYKASDSKELHLVLIKGNPFNQKEPVLVRIHSECITGDLFGSSKCDCGSQLQSSLKQIEEKNRGVLIYLRQEGRGIGLLNKLKAYELQEQGYDTVDANIKLGFEPDMRDFTVAAAILNDLKISKVNLMTNNPLKIKDLQKHGIEVVSREPLEIPPNKINFNYLRTKKEKLNHKLSNELFKKKIRYKNKLEEVSCIKLMKEN